MYSVAKCDICGRDYDNYMRTFFVQYSKDDSDRKCCCDQCWHAEALRKQHRYTNHIPSSCTGGYLITRLFDSKEELIDWITNNVGNKYYVICCSNEGNIITVNKNKKFWWVNGYSTLEAGDFPDWKEVVIKYHRSI